MALREILADLRIRTDTSELERADSLLGRFKASVGLIAGALAAGAGAVGLSRFALEQATIADNADKMAAALGLQTRELLQWQEVVQNAGGDVQQFSAGLRAFSVRVTAAQRGSKEAAAAMRELGLSGAEVRRGDVSELLDKAVLGLRRIPSTARRAAIAQELFGESGQALIRVSLDGAEALNKQRAAFDRLNRGKDLDRFVANSKEAAIAQDNWRNATAGLRRSLANAILPVLTRLTEIGTDVVEWFQETSRGSRILEVGLGVLAAAAAAAGIALLAAFAGPIAVVLGVVAGFTVLVLIIDDLIALFTGGRSAIGAFIDELFGVGTAEKVVKSLKDTYEGMIQFTEFLIEETVKLGEALGEGLAAAVLWVEGLLDDLVGAWDAAVGFVARQIERVVGLIDDAVGLAKTAADTVSGLFGEDDDDEPARARRPGELSFIPRLPTVADTVSGSFGDDDEPASARRPGDLSFIRRLPTAAIAAAPSALVSPSPAALAAGSRVADVRTTLSISVSGAGDPDAVAEAVERRIRESMQADAEHAADVLVGID